MIITMEKITEADFEHLWDNTKEHIQNGGTLDPHSLIEMDGEWLLNDSRVPVKDVIRGLATFAEGMCLRETPDGPPLLFMTGKIVDSIFMADLLLVGKDANSSVMWCYRRFASKTNAEMLELYSSIGVVGVDCYIFNNAASTKTFLDALGGVPVESTDGKPHYLIRWD